MKCHSRVATLVLTAVFSSCFAATVNAVLINYRITGNGTGTIGAQGFSGADFSLQISADTLDVVPFSRGSSSGFESNHVVGTLQVDGLPTATITEGVRVFVNNSIDTVGLSGDFSADLINLNRLPGVGLDTYDLEGPFGPVTDPSPFFSQFVDVGSDLGDITFSSIASATFTAIAIPEPNASAYCALLTILLVCYRRKSVALRAIGSDGPKHFYS